MSAEAGEVEGDDNVLAVGGDDFNARVIGGHILGVVFKPDEPAGRREVTGGGGIAVTGAEVAERAEIFGDESKVA